MPRIVDVPEQIRHEIVAGILPFGGRVTIDELASRYGVSHMPVREALRELRGEGLVIIEPNRGARIRPIDQKFVANLFETRSALEIMLSRRAADRFKPEEANGLERIEDELESEIARCNWDAVLVSNRRFHQLVNRVADNPDALALVDRHWLLIAALWQRYGYGPERFAGVASDHRYLIKCFRNNDAEGAAVLMGAHVLKARQELLERMRTAASAAAMAVG
ncbi:MAG: GntR family transcriptional regulator [Rhizobiales bacterium]|nr:GntR family transcriptional regulator [Hyphomicrobiales bacterium]